MVKKEYAKFNEFHVECTFMAQDGLWRRIEEALNDIKNDFFDEVKDCVREYKRMFEEELAIKARRGKRKRKKTEVKYKLKYFENISWKTPKARGLKENIEM